MPNRGGKRNNLVVISTSNKFGTPLIRQSDLEELIGRRRGLMEMEETMAVALSKGARVEPGIHTAELVPERRPRAGRDVFLKLVIMGIFFAMLPALCSRAGAFEDVNGDGKIDVQDFVESGTIPAASGKTEAPQNA